MKIDFDTPKTEFKPIKVIITIETLEDLEVMRAISGRSHYISGLIYDKDANLFKWSKVQNLLGKIHDRLNLE